MQNSKNCQEQQGWYVRHLKGFESNVSDPDQSLIKFEPSESPPDSCWEAAGILTISIPREELQYTSYGYTGRYLARYRGRPAARGQTCNLSLIIGTLRYFDVKT